MRSKQKPGPKPESIKLNMDWRDALGKVVKKKRPESGWPKPERTKKK